MELTTGRPGAVAARSPLTYQSAFDGLRAIAVFGVVIYHSAPELLPGGWAGVDLFFVLSGYLITRLLDEELQVRDRIGFGRFYIRRALRLTPALWSLLIFCLAVSFFVPRQGELLKSVAISGLYLMNWARALGHGASYLLGHTWSLAIEEQFYLLWPLCLTALHGRDRRRWIIAAIIIVTAWRIFLVLQGASTNRTYNGFDTHADGLLFGCLLAVTPLTQSVRQFAARWMIIPALGAAAIFLSLHLDRPLTLTVGLSVTALLSAWLIVGSLEDNWGRRLLSVRPLVFTGRISYGFYLWHYPLLILLGDNSYWPARIGMVVLSYVIASLSFFTLERGFLRLKTRFESSEAAKSRASAEILPPGGA